MEGRLGGNVMCPELVCRMGRKIGEEGIEILYSIGGSRTCKVPQTGEQWNGRFRSPCRLVLFGSICILVVPRSAFTD